MTASGGLQRRPGRARTRGSARASAGARQQKKRCSRESPHCVRVLRVEARTIALSPWRSTSAPSSRPITRSTRSTRITSERHREVPACKRGVVDAQADAVPPAKVAAHFRQSAPRGRRGCRASRPGRRDRGAVLSAHSASRQNDADVAGGKNGTVAAASREALPSRTSRPPALASRCRCGQRSWYRHLESSRDPRERQMAAWCRGRRRSRLHHATRPLALADHAVIRSDNQLASRDQESRDRRLPGEASRACRRRS